MLRAHMDKETNQLPKTGRFTISRTLPVVCKSLCGKKRTCDFVTVAKSFIDYAVKFQN